MYSYRCTDPTIVLLLDHENIRRLIKRDIRTEISLVETAQTRIDSIMQYSPAVVCEQGKGIREFLNSKLQKLELKKKILESKLPHKNVRVKDNLEVWQRTMLNLYLQDKMQLVDPINKSRYLTFQFPF